jgi:hypothetical protein
MPPVPLHHKNRASTPLLLRPRSPKRRGNGRGRSRVRAGRVSRTKLLTRLGSRHWSCHGRFINASCIISVACMPIKMKWMCRAGGGICDRSASWKRSGITKPENISIESSGSRAASLLHGANSPPRSGEVH